MNITETTRKIVELINRYAPKGTQFAWDNARSRFGQCIYKYNRCTRQYYDFKITISYPLAKQNDWETIKKTVLHEIAHARTQGHHHDRVWVRECIAIGGDGERCYRDTNQGGDVVAIPKKYIGVCPCCGAKFPRNRRTNNAYHCNRNQLIVWKLNVA